MLAGDGTDATLTFQGTLDSINAALNGLVFTPTTDFRGQAILQIISSDAGGMGGPQTTMTQMAINVIGVNHAAGQYSSRRTRRASPNIKP